ncbi:MAG: type IX secretion system membrane protein PorP/SprF, partial [Muribaculaceae bacterium]
FWAGISGTHLLQPTITMNAEGSEEKIFEAQAGRMYYFMAGSNIPIKNTLFELQPSLMVKSNFKLTQAEITARVRYKKFLSGGIAYRWKDAVSVMLGAEYKNFFLGYSFDYPVSAISKVSNGSHEVFVGYNLKLDLSDKNKNKHKSIRIM